MSCVKHRRASAEWKVALVAIGAWLATILLMTWPAGALAGPSAGPSRYPDVRTLPPSELHLSQRNVDGVVHHVVRFSTAFANLGQGPLELHGTPHVPLDGLFDARQRIYESPAGFQEESVGTFVYHPEHSHFHFDDFTRFELWTRRHFDRAMARGFAKGNPLAVRDKVSFCMFDSQRVDGSLTVSPVPVYRTCTPLMEGISVGWADVYSWFLADQSVDIGTSPLPDGAYVLRTVADPANRIWESDGRADPARESEIANQGYTYFSVVNGALVLG